ncbi:unnamed protein product [Cuscuta epithymum]|uniref:Tf2-1-like SH3-like domain-containing protein n=1 Tax=Cuscuta epithymum TaxID=186058 RepID=A0AAV0ETC7_9ASTE|nr:unnamed protein product [Cuscuta epithymum]
MKESGKKLNQKLNTGFYGPFEVVEKKNPVAYKLKLPDLVFHVSLLKRAWAPNIRSEPLSAYLNEEWGLQAQREKIKDGRVNEAGEHEILIHQKSLPKFKYFLEELHNFQKIIFEFHLEDKVLIKGG